MQQQGRQFPVYTIDSTPTMNGGGFDGLEKHFQLSVGAKTPTPPRCGQTEQSFRDRMTEMVRQLGMRQVQEPRLAYSDSPGNTGYMGFVFITTSHISFHQWDCCDPSFLRFEVYSSRKFDSRVVLDLLRDSWGCDITSAHLFTLPTPRSETFDVAAIKVKTPQAC